MNYVVVWMWCVFFFCGMVVLFCFFWGVFRVWFVVGSMCVLRFFFWFCFVVCLFVFVLFLEYGVAEYSLMQKGLLPCI